MIHLNEVIFMFNECRVFYFVFIRIQFRSQDVLHMWTQRGDGGVRYDVFAFPSSVINLNNSAILS